MNDQGKELNVPNDHQVNEGQTNFQISIYKALPINWDFVNEAARKTNMLKRNPINKSDLFEIRPSNREAKAIPMISSVIAHARNPSIAVFVPTVSDIHAMKPWLKRISKFIGRFSGNWSTRFDGFIRDESQRVLEGIGNQFVNIAETFSKIPSPRKQFVNEVKEVYKEFQKPIYHQPDTPATVEKKIYYWLLALSQPAQPVKEDNYWINSSRFPLLATMLPLLRAHMRNLDPEDIGEMSIAASEMMQGVEYFLRQSGITDIEKAPDATGLDILNPETYGRGLAQLFAPDRLERVKSKLPAILSLVNQALPENGPDFANKVYDLAENILYKKNEGLKDEEIVNELVRK